MELEDETFRAAYSSPLLRAFETALILVERLELAVETSPALMEVDVGSWSGLTRTDIETRFPEGFARWLEFGHGWDDGETYDELGERVVSGLLRIAAAHPRGSVLAVTHGGPIRSALAAADGVAFADARRSMHVVDNCALVRLVVRDEKLERVD
jgi:broad specificity phosphatase PhoE